MTSASLPHTPILVEEFLSFFKDREIKIFIDATLGAGGHSLALLESHPEVELLIGFDQDPYALEIASKRLEKYKNKLKLVHANFSSIGSLDIDLKADGIFADLGVSSMQLDIAQRGMSFSKLGPLDMRMNPLNSLTAEIIINQWPLEKLEYIFREFSEEPRWRLVAKTIVEARDNKPIKTTLDLVELLKPILKTHKKIHPATLVFQGLRIAVNDELQALSNFLPEAIKRLNPEGKLGILTFHSLEDRIVKNYFRQIGGYKGGKEHHYDFTKEEEHLIKILTKKPICPQEKEIAQNPRARSAKMRFAEKI
jgi:16S rRNA (cytosine1402-N4)-methyltransferase